MNPTRCRPEKACPARSTLPPVYPLSLEFYMMNCNTCGREIAAGSVCPYCGAHNPVAPGITTPGVLVSRRVIGTEISATHVIVGINVAVFIGMALRSEERRVGKECRSRW